MTGGVSRVLEATAAPQHRPASLASKLPVAMVPLVGREDDLASLIDLVHAHRIVSITGPGGVGKTSAMLELGRRVAADFDAVLFVALADITDAADVIPAIANALDVKEADGRTLFEGLVALVGGRTTLLLLDNLEQVVDAAPKIVQLVQRCPEARVVATSRTPLRVAGEQEYALDSLAPAAAVALFVARARSVRGSFELTAANTEVVASICRRLDGLPLAITLAAARLRLLSPEALLERLTHTLDLLTSGARDAPARHQTLRATIEWSHSLLTPAEQRLFRRMSVFVGGCTFNDVEAVCVDPGERGLDELESVVDKALVQLVSGGERLLMLQTIAEYAHEQLDAAGETADVALRHARHYAEIVHDICLGIEGSDQPASLRLGIVDEGNITAGLDALLAAAWDGDASACETGMRMCGDLLFYWHIRGKNLTARQYAQAFLDADASATPSVGRAGALVTAGLASWALGEFERSNSELALAQTMAAQVKADREHCCALFLGAVGQIGFDLQRGLGMTSDSIALSRATGFTWAEGFALSIDGILRTVGGDVDAARAQYEQALAIQQDIGDDEGAGLTLGGLAQLAAVRGDVAEALELYQRSLDAFAACGDRAEEARILAETAWTNLQNGDTVRARAFFFDSVQAYTDVASVRGVGLSLVGLAAAEAADERPENAVRIASAAEVYARGEGIVNVYSDETPGQRYVEDARAALTPEQMARATETGRSLSIREALELARTP